MIPINFQYLGLSGDPLCDFQNTWDYQREIHAQVAQDLLPTQVLLVQHSPVYTAGRRTETAEMPFDKTPVIPVDRGGKITFHGPGQLTGYPIVHLRSGVGVVDYVRRLEQAIINYLASLDIKSGRVADRTGVWVLDGDGGAAQKICAIGIRVAKRTTLHGFGLNVSTDLSYFGNIIPCGISDAGVTSIQAQLGTAPPLLQVAQDLSPYLTDMLQFEPFTSTD